MATEENKATFRRYVEEVSNKGNLDVVDEIFGRYVSRQPDGRTEERKPENVSGSSVSSDKPSPTFVLL